MFDQYVISSLIDKKCFLCQSAIKLVESNKEQLIYACGLSYKGNFFPRRAHYMIGLTHNGYDEYIVFKHKNKIYHINQWGDNYLIIDIYDNDHNYISNVEFVKFSKPVFDFLNSDLDKIIQKMKMILVFQ